MRGERDKEEQNNRETQTLELAKERLKRYIRNGGSVPLTRSLSVSLAPSLVDVRMTHGIVVGAADVVATFMYFCSIFFDDATCTVPPPLAVFWI